MPRFIPLGTAGSSGAFFVVGNAIATVLNETKGNATWTVQPNGTSGTQQNILLLDKGELILGMSNAAISFNAVNGIGIWNRSYEIRSVATLAPNVGLFVTKKDSGIRVFSDLKGKRIAVGPAGAGFETFLGPLMTAHGVAYTNSDKGFTPISADYSSAVQLLGDGDIDAAFLGGAIPMPAIIQATSTMELHYIPFDEAVLAELVEEYPFFQLATIPAKNAQGEPTYKGLDHDFPSIDVGSMHVITDGKVSDEVIYEIAKRIWENREAIAEKTLAGKAINEKNVIRDVGVAFHPGAIKFYKEIGIWKAE
jgi:TRAP transporter TAXI family solute receptor